MRSWPINYRVTVIITIVLTIVISQTWHDCSTAPQSINDIICENCNSSEDIVLVAQLYAPVDSDRSLYIFSCNKRLCSLQSNGWTVIRNQQVSTTKRIGSANSASSIDTKAATNGNGLAQPTTGRTSKAASVWDFLSDENGLDVGEDDLFNLLAQRDGVNKTAEATASLPKSHTTESVSIRTSASSSSTQGFGTSKIVESGSNAFKTKICLPCWLVEDREEYWHQKAPNNDRDDDSDEDFYANDGVTDEKIKQMLSSYYEGEEDETIIVIIESSLKPNGRSNIVDSNAILSDLATEEVSNPNTNNRTNSNNRTKKGRGEKQKKVVKEEDNHSDSEGDFNEKKYSRSSQTAKTEDYFLNRVRQYPSQVLRYAYGGNPLWITYPNPLSIRKDNSKQPITIPDCPACKIPRIYECQLMPGLLSLLGSVEKSFNTSDRQGVFGQSITDRLGHSLDYGVVTIWSCPNSCSIDGFATEIPVVQPPPDIF